MLDPQTRNLLRDTLRPPPGFQLDRALMTTFSLDLMTLLTVPLAFSLFDMKQDAAVPTVDPLALLESLRRYADRLSIFCQAGQIYLPKNVQPLVAYLEQTVHEVTSPRGGVFHPKVAVLRFTPSNHQGEHQDEVRFRFLCSSRNLTFDRSWDTMLVLDGRLNPDRKNAYSQNRPLSRFVAALPALMIHSDRRKIVEGHAKKMADELLRVELEIPDGFDELEFCPIGTPDDASWPMLGFGRSLTVSPFVSDDFVGRMRSAGCSEHFLVSRHEALDELAQRSLATLSSSFYMSTAADQSDAEVESPVDEDEPTQPATAQVEAKTLSPTQQLSGLHAKLFVADDGWNAHVWTGSANATTAAFDKNVEFLVRLYGKKKRCGVDTLLDLNASREESEEKDRSVRFADMLLKYARSTAPITDSAAKTIEKALDEARLAIAAAGLRVHISREEGSEERYRLDVKSAADGALRLPSNVAIECGLITIRDTWVRVQHPIDHNVASFNSLTFEAVTSFVSFQLTARVEARSGALQFVVNLPAEGMPEGRSSRLLMTMLRNREQLLRYLLLLLADDEDAAAAALEAFAAGSNESPDGRSEAGLGLPMLEPLLQSAERNPQRLNEISRLIKELRMSAEGRALISDEFMQIWEPIWAAVGAKGGSDA